jgi:sec-independent protein translocase protein TatC
MGQLTPKEPVRAPFIEHIYELRRRLLTCVIFVAVGAGIGYSINERLLAIIQQPLGQKLFYTSPTGGFSFVFMLCIFFGIIFALPCIIYQIIAFLKPVLPHVTRRSMLFYPVCSVILAGLGITFAYFVSLPASLHFLANFGGGNIEALITTDTYFNFALSYIVGFAILFQLPLLLIITNRITPLKPGKLMKWQRYIIVGSFILAAIITPTPDPFNQLLMAGPIIILYQLSILFIWIINKGSKKQSQVLAAVINPPPVEAASQKAYAPRPTQSVATSFTAAPPQPATRANARRRLISDISATQRRFHPFIKQPARAPRNARTPLKVTAAPRIQDISPKWDGGLIDVTR